MKKSKNWILKLFSLSVLICFCACSQSPKESRDRNKGVVQENVVDFDLDKIKERGSLRALVDNSSTSYFIYRGQLMGYEYELLTLLADELDVDLEIIVTKSIDDAFKALNNGEGDLIAFTLTVTKERSNRVAFTHPHYTTRQVLVQKKPDSWRDMKIHEIEKTLIRNQVDLIGKEVHVRKSSSYVERLQNLSEEIGGDIIIVEDEKDVETELMIKKVQENVINYTIADEDIALVNASYYPDIDIETPISFPQQIAWAVRINAKQLLEKINNWQYALKKEATYNVIYNKYYNSPRASKKRQKSDFSSIQGNKISIYDDLIKQAADSLAWDWKLLAAQIYEESGFDPNEVSWAGAIGLMQLMPDTGKRYSTTDLSNPKKNILAGMRHVKHLDALWAKTIEDKNERIKFVLASYNVGLGHVIDARDLAKKYGKNPLIWDDNVAYYLLSKSQSKYFNDEVAKSGYCRCEEPINYVKNVLSRYEQYKQLLDG